jgi:hypothetical protein
MAVYIEDKNIIKTALTKEGIELIIEKIRSYGHEPYVKIDNGLTLIQIINTSPIFYTFYNIIGISEGYTYINPISNMENNQSAMFELKYFIMTEMIPLIRNNKMQKIGI